MLRLSARPFQRTYRRLISTNEYIEKWQAATVKPNAFYEEHATDKPKKYFYSIDLQGRVFLEEVSPKNIATSLKNPKFLDFFFTNLKKCSDRDLSLLPAAVRDDYPYVSHCGVERNFVRPADAVIVFHSLERNTTNGEKLCLFYGGMMHQDFDPRHLAVSRTTGRLYHRLIGDKTKLHKENNNSHYGLIKSSVAVTLSDQIIPCDENGEENEVTSGLELVVEENRYPIHWLPDNTEPGPWSMPFIEE